MSVKPISPSKVKTSIPDVVVEIFNDLIEEFWQNNQSKVPQSRAVSDIAFALEIPKQNVFNKGYLNIEELYRKAGWVVIYSSPDWGESGDSYFIFKKG